KNILRDQSNPGPKMRSAAQNRFASGRGIFFLLGMAFMGLLEAFLPAFHGSALSRPVANARTISPAPLVTRQQKPGGDFEYTPLPLEVPREFLPDTTKPL